MSRVIFLGGNGHCAARLDAARRALTREVAPFELWDTPYPGFEGRARAADLDTFFGQVGDSLAALVPKAGPCLLYGTGIGGLLLLGLRGRGFLQGARLLLQAPVLWGLEHRFMPRLLRRLPAPGVLPPLFSWPPFQRWFCRRHFVRPPSPETAVAFFEGYRRCSALGDFFRWLGPELLRGLERTSREVPAAFASTTVWWGDHDRVVSRDGELPSTEAALGVRWPVRRFPSWGHYPMMDDPEGWVDEVGAELHRC